jgi:hypothetical protein
MNIRRWLEMIYDIIEETDENVIELLSRIDSTRL